MMQTAYVSTEQHVATVVAAYVTAARGPMTATEVKNLIIDVRKGFIADLTQDEVEEEDPFLYREPQQKELGITPSRKLTPKEIQATIRPDFITCLEDGKPYKVLAIPLRRFGMTAEQYKQKWGLAHDYPMVAPNYSASRKAMAQSMGLGRIK